MRRIIVAGGFGFFGGAIVTALRAEGYSPLVGSRRPVADIVIDVEDCDSLSHGLRRGDIVVDAVGPFQQRTTRLVQSAAEIGFDLVDLADSVNYVSRMHRLQDCIGSSGVRVFTACSAISSVSACAVRLSGWREPRRVTGFLAPATRYTAVAGTAASLFASVGRPVHVFAEGGVRTEIGWSIRHTMTLPAPIGTRTAYLFESADAITLPAVWPSLRTVNFFVDTNVRGLNGLFRLAARFAILRALIGRVQRPGLRLSRWLGRASGGLGYEIAGEDGRTVRLSFVAARHGYVTAIAPAVIAVRRLIEDRVPEHGLIPPDRHVEPEEFLALIQRAGIDYCKQTDDGGANDCELS